MNIHPTAIIEDNTEVAEDVIIGPYSVIKSGVSIGSGTTIDAHTVIEGRTTIGKNNKIGIGAVIGNPPQDLKYNGEDTETIIGDNCIIREYVTINRGTKDRKKTEIGNNTLIMSYVHVAHDCKVGDEVILANCATLAGHITVEDQAVIGGVTPIHQFSRIGKMAIVGGGTRIPKDVPPFCTIAGNPAQVCGLNDIGLKRRNYSAEERANLKKAYKLIFRAGLNTAQAAAEIEKNSFFNSESVKYLIEFIKDSKRGIIKN